jgi:hypothetical protein
MGAPAATRLQRDRCVGVGSYEDIEIGGQRERRQSLYRQLLPVFGLLLMTGDGQHCGGNSEGMTDAHHELQKTGSSRF